MIKKKFFKQQSKLSLDAIHKNHTNYESYTFEQN